MLFLAGLLFSSLGLAAVTIQPGQSITVQASTRATEVRCAPAAAPAPAEISSNPPAFCYCRPLALEGSVDFNLIRVTTAASGERSETTLKNYVSSKACDKAIASYPACR